MSVEGQVAENLARVRGRIAAACGRVGRDPSEVALVAVTKYGELEWVRALVAAGAHDLGESRPQQLVARAVELALPVRWHLIGHLQRNKVKLVLPHTCLIHSVDSLRLLESISQQAGERGQPARVLLELHLSGEAAKDGFDKNELLSIWDQARALPHVQIEGLMTMAAYATDPEDARPTFAALSALRDELRSRSPATCPLKHLSMGMSGDFEIAVEEGATIVRVGSALWEGLATAEGHG